MILLILNVKVQNIIWLVKHGLHVVISNNRSRDPVCTRSMYTLSFGPCDKIPDCQCSKPILTIHIGVYSLSCLRQFKSH